MKKIASVGILPTFRHSDFLCIKVGDSITIHRTEHKGSYKLQHDIQKLFKQPYIHSIQFQFDKKT